MAKILFHKYQDNRRLWNTTDSEYATIKSVMEAIQKGHEVTILALPGKAFRHKNSMMEDITHPILVDALGMAEHERPQLSVEVLHQLIRGQLPKED